MIAVGHTRTCRRCSCDLEVKYGKLAATN